MKTIYCSKCVKHTKFKKSKPSYFWSKALVLSTSCDECSNNNDKIFKEESIEQLKILGLTQIIYI